ncbi:hypothetical protein SLS58_003010 [Diplodia intermedia]|uniref:Carboxylesterase type B domain-containing protein n=1 Tax=Diplodia intermedia TaxID=856260 RepID=A0ABR3TY81_9PEZI
MSTTTLNHPTLNATLHGVVRHDGAILQFRGIKYGRVPARFAPPVALDDWKNADVDCTEYGPRCPQQAFDVGHLLRLPEDVELPREREDEFECLNLDVSVPAAKVEGRKRGELLPVMVWIHGEYGANDLGWFDGSEAHMEGLRLMLGLLRRLSGDDVWLCGIWNLCWP